jgi:hypothetical protein
MSVSLNWYVLLPLIVANFALGAIWYSAIFGNLWMHIHHGDRVYTPTEMAELSKGMWKLLLAEFVSVSLVIVGLACVVQIVSTYSPVYTAFMVWLAFVLPIIASSALWGNDNPKYMLAKISISGAYRLVSLLASGYILGIYM